MPDQYRLRVLPSYGFTSLTQTAELEQAALVRMACSRATSGKDWQGREHHDREYVHDGWIYAKMMHEAQV